MLAPKKSKSQQHITTLPKAINDSAAASNAQARLASPKSGLARKSINSRSESRSSNRRRSARRASSFEEEEEEEKDEDEFHISPNVFPDWLVNRSDFQKVFREYEGSNKHLHALRKNIQPLDGTKEKTGIEKLDTNGDGILSSEEWQAIDADGDGQVSAEELQKLNNYRNDEDVMYIYKWIREVGLDLFKTYDYAKLLRLAGLSRHKSLKEGEEVCKQGDEALSYYIVAKGSLKGTTISSHEHSHTHHGHPHVKHSLIRKNESFGEVAVLNCGGIMNRTIVALEATELLELRRDDHMMIQEELRDDETWLQVAFLRQSILFSQWSRSRLLRLCNTLEEITYAKGTTIVKQGDQATSMYFIKLGTCTVRQDVPITKTNKWPTADRSVFGQREAKFIKPIEIAKLNPGDYFGEEAIMSDQLRPASVVSNCVVQLLVLHKKDFVHLLQGKTLELMKDNLQTYRSEDQIRAEYDKHHQKELAWKSIAPNLSANRRQFAQEAALWNQTMFETDLDDTIISKSRRPTISAGSLRTSNSTSSLAEKDRPRPNNRLSRKDMVRRKSSCFLPGQSEGIPTIINEAVQTEHLEAMELRRQQSFAKRKKKSLFNK